MTSLGSFSSHLLKDVAEFMRSANDEAAIHQYESQIGKANLFSSILCLHPSYTDNCGIDINSILRWSPNPAAFAIANSNYLTQHFNAADIFGKVRLIEFLLSSDRSALVLTLVDALPTGVEKSNLRMLAAIVQARHEFRYEVGRAIIAQLAAMDASEAAILEAARIAAYDFLDFDLSRKLLYRTPGSSNAETKRQIISYIDEISRIRTSEGGSAFGFVEGLGIIDNLTLVRSNWAAAIDNESASQILINAGKIPDWHARRAAASLLKTGIEAGLVNNFSVIGRVCIEMVNYRCERAAVDLFMQVPFHAPHTLSLDEFRAIQWVMMVANSREARLSVGRKALQELSGEMTPPMAKAIHRAMSNDSWKASGRGIPEDALATTLPPAQGREPWRAPATIVTDKVLSAPRGAQSRIALCLSGQLRSFEANWDRIYHQVVAPLEADVFVSTWDKAGFGTGYGADISRFLDPAVVSVLPPHYLSSEVFFAKFPSVHHALMSQPTASVDLLRRASGLTAMRIHDEAAFDKHVISTYLGPICRPGVEINEKLLKNNLKMFYTMWDSFQLMDKFEREHGIHYDIVIRMRPDVSVREVCAPSIQAQMTCSDVVYVHHYHPYGISDQFAFGSRAAMQIYMCGFEEIDRRKSFDLFEVGIGTVGESFLFDMLNHHGVRCHSTQAIEYELSSRIIDQSRLIALMMQDVSRLDDLCADTVAALEAFSRK